MPSLSQYIFVSFFSLAFFTGARAESAAPVQENPESLVDFVKTKWKISTFELGKHVVESVISLRVSTHSSPPFIHKAQVERLGSYEKDLSGLCERQNGLWTYLGPPVTQKSAGAAQPTNPALAKAVSKTPPTEQGLREVVRIGEQTVAADVLNAMLDSYRDPLGREAVEFAVTQKMLGRFECQNARESWIAAISVTEVKPRKDGYLTYRDAFLKVDLKPAK